MLCCSHVCSQHHERPRSNQARPQDRGAGVLQPIFEFEHPAVLDQRDGTGGADKPYPSRAKVATMPSPPWYLIWAPTLAPCLALSFLGTLLILAHA